MKKIYPTITIIYTVLLGITFNLAHYLRVGMSFRSPEYFWYLGIAKGVIEPYGSSIGNILTLPAKLDPTQYFLRGIYSIYPSIYTVQVFSSICFVAVGITAFFLGREVFRDSKYRDQLGVIFSACLITLYPLIFIYTAVFTHDTLQMVFVLAVLFFGIKIINTKSFKLLPILIALFFFGLGINMSMMFTAPILALYLLRNKVDFKILLFLIVVLSIASSYLTMQQLEFGNQVDVVPIAPEQIFKAFLIPLTISIVGLYKCIKDKNVFILGTFIYLFVAMLFMARNMRWVTIPIALLIVYGLKENIVSLSGKSVFKKIRRNIISYIIITLIMFQTVALFGVEDIADDCIAYGVHEIEIDGTQEFLTFCGVYEGIELIFFVETDRHALIEVYASEKTEIVYDKSLWLMTEQEAYKYVLEKYIDAVFFYPRDYNEQWFKQGDRVFSQISSNVVSGKELNYIIRNKRFLDKLYRDEELTYFRTATKREIRTNKKIYYFRVICPIHPAQLYFAGVDLSFLDEED